MEIINITNARQNLFQLISDVNKGFNPINIVNSKGDDAVLISGSDWRDIEETIYLNSIPGYVDSVKEALEEDRSKCSVYKKGEKW
ncbi:MAG: type II toxin-antitoxin system Phd/YefM family antitoxin [Bacilli bacterium]|nr:type II toxin-antitoxin system Phd/YefM family antitoxin [Bacilli bacterium]